VSTRRKQVEEFCRLAKYDGLILELRVHIHSQLTHVDDLENRQKLLNNSGKLEKVRRNRRGRIDQNEIAELEPKVSC